MLLINTLTQVELDLQLDGDHSFNSQSIENDSGDSSKNKTDIEKTLKLGLQNESSASGGLKGILENGEALKSSLDTDQLLNVEKEVGSSSKDILSSKKNGEVNRNFTASLVKAVQKEPLMEKVLEKVDAYLNEQSEQDIDIEPLNMAREKASQLLGQGRELAARREISDAITEIDQQVSKGNQAETNKPTEAEQYLINEAIQSLTLGSKNVMVTEISKKLSQMAIDFKQAKREITNNLDIVSRMMSTPKAVPKANMQQVLDSTINKLDQAILKSDFMLYADMDTEKKMLSASSQLAEARKLLNKGEFDEANTIVKEVRANLDKLIFKPSDVKVKHFVSDANDLDSFLPKKASNLFEQSIQSSGDHERTARHVFESMRKLGLNHENDAAHSLLKSTASHEGIANENENLKSTLLKMMQSDDINPKINHQVEQVINNLTGQQLLNKQDSSGIQNMFMQLPFLINKQVENMKVYINSQKNGEKIDWENCSLYFVLETKKLGDIGILLSSSNKDLSITFRSNKESLAEKLDSFKEISKERFNEIGYSLSGLTVKPLSLLAESRDESMDNASILTPAFTEKGYDFSI